MWRSRLGLITQLVSPFSYAPFSYPLYMYAYDYMYLSHLSNPQFEINLLFFSSLRVRYSIRRVYDLRVATKSYHDTTLASIFQNFYDSRTARARCCGKIGEQKMPILRSQQQLQRP